MPEREVSGFVPLIWATLVLAGCGGGDASLEDIFPEYPEAVMARAEADLDKYKSAVLADGVPASIDEISMWFPEPPPGENAAVVYETALAEASPERQMDLFAKAAAMEHCRYPIAWEASIRAARSQNPLTVEVIPLALPKSLRDSSRLLYDAALASADSGDSEKTTQHLVSALGLCRHLGRVYFSIVQLARSACFGLTEESIERALNAIAFDDLRLVRIQTALQRAECPDAIARTWFVERAIYGYDDSFEHMPNAAVTFAKQASVFRVAWTAVAAERYRLAEGRAPEKLEELVPKYLETVPTDPLSGKPLLYSKNDVCFVVHAVGTDSVPDPNVLSYALDYYSNDEVVFRVDFEKHSQIGASTAAESSAPIAWDSHSEEEQTAAKSVARLLRGQGGGSSASEGIVQIEMGTLNDGVAVVLKKRWSMPSEVEIPIDAAFWVKDGQVHTVNAKARNIAPDLPAAPDEITEEHVRAVAR